MKQRRRLLIAGGGTGGHFFPALAVAQAWLAAGPEREVLMVGTQRGIEARLCGPNGLPLRTLSVQRLKGGGLKGWLLGLLALPRAGWQAWQVLREFQPGAVLGVGGYASGPVVMLAALGRWPSLIMEQNARPGMTNRILARFVRRVVLGLPGAERWLPAGKTVVLGNPVRDAIAESLAAALDAQQERAPGTRPHLLVVGGSQGARGINRVVPAAVAALKARGLEPEVRLQTGRLDAESVAAELHALGLDEQVRATVFIDDMAEAYAWADLVLCRAGATTLAELAVAQRPAVLVPFPHAADNHQEANAQALVAVGGARMIRQSELDAEGLADTLAELFASPEALRTMGVAAGTVARPEAARQVVALIEELMGGAAPAGGAA